ncbi:hypothetical protein NSND_50616 [Nitrospira sp. ND1]|nr:hypothetical protein NSND_50616 [Nitrospira sp. ND1]
MQCRSFSRSVVPGRWLVNKKSAGIPHKRQGAPKAPPSGFATFKSLHVPLGILVELLFAGLRAEIIRLPLPGAAEGSRFLLDPHPARAIHFFLVCHGPPDLRLLTARRGPAQGRALKNHSTFSRSLPSSDIERRSL